MLSIIYIFVGFAACNPFVDISQSRAEIPSQRAALLALVNSKTPEIQKLLQYLE